MKHKNAIDKAIDNVLEFMGKHEPDSEEYAKAVHNLKELCEARSKKDPQIMSVLTIVIPALTNILGIGMILYHEELNVITSKALGFVAKGGRL